jgi:peptidoglycan/xylan/chitin deacetylase (PgdA/CDA1 family)
VIRAALRNMAMTCLHAKAVLTSELTALNQNRVQILMFHDLCPEDEGRFGALIDELSVDHAFTTYSDAVKRIYTGVMEKPYVTFSFDDGFESASKAAAILDRYGIKGCFFVCPSILTERNCSKVDEFCRWRLHTNPKAFLTWRGVEKLKAQGHEIGNHTLNHLRLSELDGDALEYEIGNSAEVLKRRLGDVKHFAWPYGRFSHFSSDAAKVVLRAGAVSAASGERGCHSGSSGDSLLCLRRDNIDLQWPWAHIQYFLAHNAASRRISSGSTWPSDWTG